MTSMSRVQSFSIFRFSRAALAACLLTASAAVFAQATPAVSTVFAFNGSVPNGGIVQGPDGGLYGTAASNTLVAGGLVYRSTIDGSSVTTIHQMTLDDGYAPKAGPLEASNGLLYGTTRLGLRTEPYSAGTIYRVAYDGSGYTTLHSFEVYAVLNVNGNPINSDGAYPETALIEGSDGYLYGTTRAGGANGTGVIFRISLDGSEFSVLHQFGPITSDTTDALPKNIGGSNPIGGVVQAPVGEAVRAVEDDRGRRAPVRVPVTPHPFDVAVDAACRDDDGLARDLEGLAARLGRSRETRDAAAAGDEGIHAMPEPQPEQVAARMREQPLHEQVGERATRAPDEMESRNRVAGHVESPFDPHRHRHEADAHRGQPVVDLRDAAFDISLRPGARPGVLGTELTEGKPVRIAEFRPVDDAAEAGKHVGDHLAGGGVPDDRHELERRMTQDQTDEVCSGVAGSSNDRRAYGLRGHLVNSILILTCASSEALSKKAAARRAPRLEMCDPKFSALGVLELLARAGLTWLFALLLTGVPG